MVLSKKHYPGLRKIEADEPRMSISSRTLLRLADYFEVKYWTKLVTGDR